MIRSDEGWLSVTDAFYSAAIDGSLWHGALDALATGTGSRAGELIGLGARCTVPFHWVTGLGEGWVEEFVADGGGDPANNPFVRAGSRIPVLEVLSSAQFITPEERRTDYFITHHATRHDIIHICLTPLIKEPGMLVGLAVMRGARQGEITPEQRRIFATIAPHVRAAVRMQMALEQQGAAIMANALEALSAAVFICDRVGTVKAMTAAAEAIVSRGDLLRLRQGRLCAPGASATRSITEAIALNAAGLIRPGPPPVRTIALRSAGAAPLLLEVLPLPARNFTLGFEPRALVIVRGGDRPAAQRLRELLRLLYQLTDAESEVALHLAAGDPPEAVAMRRGTSVGTVRAQIRAIYAKLGVSRQGELVSRINQLR